MMTDDMVDTFYDLSIIKDKSQNKKIKKFHRCVRKNENPVEFVLIYQNIIKEYRNVKASKFQGQTILQLLDKIIPQEFFGSTQNRKRFYSVVNRITTHTKFECVFKSVLAKNYDLISIKWLRRHHVSKQQRRLIQANILILDNVVKPLISHFYICYKTLKSYEMKFVLRNDWNKYQTKIFKTLVNKVHLISGNCQQGRGFLKIYPKSDLSSEKYRPIMCSKPIDSSTKHYYKKLSKKIKRLAVKLSSHGRTPLFSFWDTLTTNIGSRPLYGIKLDVEDAYGNVNIKKLIDLIHTAENDLLADEEKIFLLDHIENQFVHFNKKIFKWNHGLLQGDRLSAVLCDLYMSFMEYGYLRGFIKNHYSFIRVADDYLYCTTEFYKVKIFEKTLKCMYPINDSKTEKASDCDNTDENYINFSWDPDDIPFSNNILVFNGQVINFRTKHISKLYKIDSVRYKSRCMNKERLESSTVTSSEKLKAAIIKRGIRYSTHCQYFMDFHINTNFNSEKAVLTNYFKGMVFVAYKVDVFVRLVAETRNACCSQELPFLLHEIQVAIKYHAKKIHQRLMKNKGKYFEGGLNYRLLRNIGYRAFILVLKTNSTFYKSIIDAIDQKNYLYLLLGSNNDIANVFTKLPDEFREIVVNRKSQI